ncbi:hypothetical protein PSV08DRAFT_151672, partial [Bipolaris maydis]
PFPPPRPCAHDKSFEEIPSKPFLIICEHVGRRNLLDHTLAKHPSFERSMHASKLAPAILTHTPSLTGTQSKAVLHMPLELWLCVADHLKHHDALFVMFTLETSSSNP